MTKEILTSIHAELSSAGVAALGVQPSTGGGKKMSSKLKLSPGPWAVVRAPFGRTVISNGDELCICEMKADQREGIDPVANAERIVACVNALEGISDPENVGRIIDEWKELKKKLNVKPN